MVRRWRQIGGRTSPGQLFAFHYMKCPELGENRPWKMLDQRSEIANLIS